MRMTKKARRVPMESSPSSSSYPTAEESRARFKFRSLLQDYEEVLKDTEAKRKTLEKAKQKKTKLLAEIKFLRRKYKLLAGNPSQGSQYRIKKKSYRILSPSPQTVHIEPPLVRKNHKTKEAASTSSAAVLDLNQISLPNDEEMDCQVDWTAPKIEKSSRCAVDEDAVSGDLKLSICRDVQKNPSRIGKRKITWQDQVALKV